MCIKIGCPFFNLSFKAQIYSKEVFFLVRLNFMIWGDDNLKMEVVINKCHLFFFFQISTSWSRANLAKRSKFKEHTVGVWWVLNNWVIPNCSEIVKEKSTKLKWKRQARINQHYQLPSYDLKKELEKSEEKLMILFYLIIFIFIYYSLFI